jgi:hydroxyquinol 1,2-dioxygenase
VPASYPIPSDGPVGKMLGALGRHPMRPAHIHFIVSATGYDALTTHVFLAGDPYLSSDAVFGVKEALIRDVLTSNDMERATARGMQVPFKYLDTDISLQHEAAQLSKGMQA